MISPIINKKLVGNLFITIEIFTLKNQINYAISKIRKTNEELHLVDSKITSLIDVSYLKKLNAPIFLTINSDKVLNNTIDSLEKNTDTALKKAFPSLQLKDFYFDTWVYNSKTIVSIIRKTHFDNILFNFDEINYLIYHIYIGISSLNSIIEYFPTENVNSVIFLNSKKLDLTNFIVINHEETSNICYTINDIDLSNQNLLAFSSIVSCFFNTKSIDCSNNTVNLNKQLRDNYLQTTLRKKGMIYLIYFTLGVLILNYFAFSYYFDKYNQLNTMKSEIEIKLINLRDLKKEVIEKENLLTDLSLSKNNQVSLLINEILKDTPENIFFTNLTLNPLVKREQNENLSKYDNNTIIISGNAEDKDSFGKWVELLSNKKFIDNVTVISFGKDEKLFTVFTIKILFI